jgi:hypothetical protein
VEDQFRPRHSRAYISGIANRYSRQRAILHEDVSQTRPIDSVIQAFTIDHDQGKIERVAIPSFCQMSEGSADIGRLFSRRDDE